MTKFKPWLLLIALILTLGLINACTVPKDADMDSPGPPDRPQASNDGIKAVDEKLNGDLPPVPEAPPAKPLVAAGTIDMSNQGLSEFPKEILKETKTKILILSGNSLRTLPSEIGELTNLEELYLDNNQLEGALVAEIRKMPRLKILDASDNNMTGIPAEIGQMSNLEVLDYSNNQLDTYPNEIVNMKSLKTLDLSGNRYSPESLEAIQVLLPQTEVIY